ncbi:hypothetical protein L914_01228 [Phytophthora nicotianae]|uniref:PiggyBac transposable element-derived protein domain-containing protein n=1 Tax=Phytophthora nicotianae TaxID=4792 RepID=W2P4E7_PHYNI|nr:hypothetical protein L914_01228 [Phytophthora nicotianae]
MYYCSKDTDINVTRAGDSSEDYMAFDSDGENDDGFDNNDDKLNFEALDSYDDDDIAPHDVMFGAELLAAVGGIEGILADVLGQRNKAHILREISNNGWSDA